jgi:hypothetical protein
MFNLVNGWIIHLAPWYGGASILSFDGPYKKGHIAIHHLNLTKAYEKIEEWMLTHKI